MKWYSDNLLLHGERLCKIASSIFNTNCPQRCNPQYRASHQKSPLNAMSVVSDLTSVLRPPKPPPTLHPSTAQSQSLTADLLLVQTLTNSESSDETDGKPSQGVPGMPFTPSQAGSIGAAPHPRSWPVAQSRHQAGCKQATHSNPAASWPNQEGIVTAAPNAEADAAVQPDSMLSTPPDGAASPTADLEFHSEPDGEEQAQGRYAACPMHHAMCTTSLKQPQSFGLCAAALCDSRLVLWSSTQADHWIMTATRCHETTALAHCQLQ